MKKIGLGLLLLAALVQTGIAQELEGEDVVIGKTYHFEPITISGQWDVQVSLPDDYDTSNDRYPVVYVLHGDFYFKFAVGGFQRIVEFGDMPAAIIVGVSNESNAYFAFGTKQADLFLDFMEEILFPFVEGKFRTHEDRTIMGWHYTSGFIFHALANRPHLFKNYIPASPYLQGYDVSTIELWALEQMAIDQPTISKSLYFGVLDNERSVREAAQDLDSLLTNVAPKNLNWEFKMLQPDIQDGIGISVYRLWRTGLMTVYADYKAEELSFPNTESLKGQGGIGFLRQHYTERANSYGGSPHVPNAFSLILAAQRADDFALFEELMPALNSNYENLNLGLVLGFAEWYLKNGRADEALEIYESVNAFHPNSISIYEGLALARVTSGKTQDAVAAYETAIELARTQRDDRLESIEDKLAELNL